MRLYFLNGCLHGVEARLVHEADQLHADDDHFGIGGHILHHFFEFGDGTEENRTVQTLHVYLFAHLIGDTALVAPGFALVEVGLAGVWQTAVQVGLAYGGGAVASFHQVAGTFHEQHAGDDHADAHGGEQVNKYRHQQHNHQYHGIGLGDLEEVFETFEVDDAPAHGDEDAGQHRQRHILDHASQSQQDGQQDEGVNHAAQLCATTAFDIDYRAHGGSGSWETAEETCDGIADTLAYEFFVGVMLGFSDVVGNHRSEQGVDRTQTSQREAGDDGGLEDGEPVDASHVNLALEEHWQRQARGYVADDKLGVETAEEGYYRHHNKGY